MFGSMKLYGAPEWCSSYHPQHMTCAIVLASTLGKEQKELGLEDTMGQSRE
jgi:hypothetical protein